MRQQKKQTAHQKNSGTSPETKEDTFITGFVRRVKFTCSSIY